MELIKVTQIESIKKWVPSCTFGHLVFFLTKQGSAGTNSLVKTGYFQLLNYSMGRRWQKSQKVIIVCFMSDFGV